MDGVVIVQLLQQQPQVLFNLSNFQTEVTSTFKIFMQLLCEYYCNYIGIHFYIYP